MPFVDPTTILDPSPGGAATAAWGDILNADLNFLNLRGPITVTAATRPSSPFEGQVIFEADTNRFFVYTGTEWQLFAGSLPRCRAGDSVGNNIATATNWEYIWLSEDAPGYDTDSIHSTGASPGRFTVPTGCGGLWHVEASLTMSTTTNATLWFEVHGVTGRWGQLHSGSTSSITSSATIPVAAGQALKVMTRHETGTERLYGGDITKDYCAVHFVGPTF